MARPWKPIDYVAAGVLVVCAIVLVWFGLWAYRASFEFIYGDSVREIIRDEVKPESLK